MSVITISRQYGSGGDEIASRLCEILSYRYFDKSLMADMASEVGLAPGEVIDFAEHQHQLATLSERLFGSVRTVRRAQVWTEDTTGTRKLQVVELDEAESVTIVQSIIQAAYKRGNVVLVGRGGQVILKGQPGVLHVRIEAPLEERTRRVADREGIATDGARDLIIKRDRTTADYLRTFYNVDWTDSSLYHMVINTGLWGIEPAVKIIVDSLQHLPAGTAMS